MEFRNILEFDYKSGRHPAHQQPPDELCQSLQHCLPPDVLVNWEEQSQGQTKIVIYKWPTQVPILMSERLELLL